MDGRLVVNYELKMTFKGTTVVYFKIISQNLAGWAAGSHRKPRSA
jgi:hypothetical protein